MEGRARKDGATQRFYSFFWFTSLMGDHCGGRVRDTGKLPPSPCCQSTRAQTTKKETAGGQRGGRQASLSCPHFSAPPSCWEEVKRQSVPLPPPAALALRWWALSSRRRCDINTPPQRCSDVMIQWHRVKSGCSPVQPPPDVPSGDTRKPTSTLHFLFFAFFCFPMLIFENWHPAHL